ncbi:MAG TPA: hypothetical protein VD793_09620, partial [Gemmatimonadales bacterium]|nr:hypothetical protein [Gemmatimonadales bacterium]
AGVLMGIRHTVVAVVGATLACPGLAVAQLPGVGVPDRPFVVIGRRDLRFGTVLPGIPTSIPHNHPRFSGEFEVQGTAGASVRVELLLPANLAASGGALLPISFAGGDGSHDFPHGLPHRTEFDPHLPVVAGLGPNGKLHVWLGGTVFPAAAQTSGTYVATIAITVFNLGI